MDVVLGLSMTATAGRVVLVEGERADGVTIESEAFDTIAQEGIPKPSPSEQVSNAILATQQNARSIGHNVIVSGVTWDDDAQQDALRDSMIARGLDNVVLMSEQSAAGALARTIGCALGYGTTAVLLMKPETATLSIVDSADGSITEGPTCRFDGAKFADLLPDFFSDLDANKPRPRGMVVVGSCAEINAIKSRLESIVALPVIVPEEPEFGLARGAALVAADAVGLEAATVGLAYSQDPDDDEVGLSAANTEISPPLEVKLENDFDWVATKIGRAPLTSTGFFVGAMCVLGVVALCMSLAVGIGTTTGDSQSMRAAENAAASSLLVPKLPPAQGSTVAGGPTSIPRAQVIQPPPPPSNPEPVAIAPEPPVTAQVIAPAPQHPAPSPAVAQPAPSRVITEPTPVAAESPMTPAPAAVEAPPAEAAPIPAAAPPPVVLPPVAAPAPPPPQAPPFTFPPITLRIGPFRIPLGPSQPAAPPPQQLSPAPPPQQATPPPYWSPPQAPNWSPPPPYAPRGKDNGRGRWWPWD